MRTSRELIAEARRVERRVRSTLDTTVADLVRDLADALEAATNEWEYGVVRSATGNCWPVADIHEARETAVDGYEAIRRRPCSPWQPLPVKGESA